jgi:hypothetical protein
MALTKDTFKTPLKRIVTGTIDLDGFTLHQVAITQDDYQALIEFTKVASNVTLVDSPAVLEVGDTIITPTTLTQLIKENT